MLTSSNQSNQYLRPDYLTPLPTTLDAKNSPLALLAQTCSAIGSDSPNPKLLANIEKSTKSHKLSIDSNRDKSSPNSNQSSLSNGSLIDHQQTTIKSSFKPYESSITNTMRERSNLTPSSDEQQQQRSLSNLGANYNSNSNNNNNNSNTHHNNINSNNNNNNTIRIKTPKTLHNGQQQQQQRCDSNQSATSQTRDSSPAAILNGGSLSSTSSSSRKTPQQHHQRDNNDSQSPHQQQRASSKDSLNNISLSQNSPNTNRIPNDLSKDITSLTKSSVMPNNNNNSSIPSSAASYFSGYPTGLSGFPMDLLTAGFMPHHPMMKAAALNSYFNYARPKGSGGGGGGDPTAGMMPPICRDPYCTGCPTMSPHVLNKATGQQCPPSCQQCDSSVSKSYQQHSNAAAAYAHAQLAALAAASQLPYVCSWIAGDSAYCGKRYGTSDELFQHLRTHTASMPESMLNAVAASGLPPNHPLFQRTYPTPPLSPLSSARYHPYGKPSMYPPTLGPPSLAGLQIPQHPSLAPYFSPYSLYGPRLGASPSMHP